MRTPLKTARHRALLIEKLKYTIAKLRHEKFGEVFRSMASEMLLRSQRKLHHAFQELVRRQADEVVHDKLLGV
jgi:hypothetical protein